MKTLNTKSRFGVYFWSVLLSVGMLMSALPGTAAAKAIFVCSEHHARLFDAWNINPDGTINKLGTYGLAYATDPAGIAIDTVDPHTGTIIFITSEFSSGIEIVEVPPVGTPTSLGRSSGPSNLAGIDIDVVDNIVYTIRRRTNDLYIYSWDTVCESLTQLAMIDLPGLSYGYGLALDETQDILWVADSGAGVARAYDIATWTELTGVSFTPSHKPVDIAVDRGRQLVYTVSMTSGAATPSGTGSYLISKFDLTTRIETTVNMGHEGVGVAVDEVSGFVYVTGSPAGSPDDTLSVWDPSTSPFTRIQETGDIGNPAGLAIANVIVNQLNLAKNDVVVGRGIYIGQTFTYEITCDNTLNPDLDATGVTILDFLPLELDFVSATHGGIYDLATHAVLWDIGTIPAGGTGPTIELVVRVNENAIGGSTIYNYCTIEGEQIPPTTVIGEDPDAPPGEEPGSYIIPNRPPVADASGPYVGNEGSPITFDGTGSSDPDGDPLTYDWDFGDSGAMGPTPTHTYANNGTYDVCLTVTDSAGASDTQSTTAEIANVAPTVGPITAAPMDPIQVGTPILPIAEFEDPGTADTHTAEWDCGDGSVEPGTVIQGAGFGTVCDPHTYTEAGIYTVALTVTDDDGGIGESEFQYVVVYDPTGGFVTGGGWIDSPAGAYTPDPDLTGKANFGFVSKYKKGAEVPTGNTEFQFHAGDLNFHSSSYEWLVVTGSDYARFKGTGTINGYSGYRFMLWAGDAPDTFRIRIWTEDEFGIETVKYDNGFDQAIGGGSIIIHTGKK